jgi:SAM-dependent methyltransferase
LKLNTVERWVVNSPLRRAWLIRNLDWFQRVSGLPSGRVVAEIGCGSGKALDPIRRRFRPSRLLAVDLDLRMLRTAAATGKAPVAAADAAALPLAAGSVDAVFCLGVLHHVPHWQKALGEVASALAPGGVFCFEEFYPALYQNCATRRLLVHPETNRFHSRELAAGMSAVGLVVRHRIEIRPFYVLGTAVKGGARGVAGAAGHMATARRVTPKRTAG